MSDRTIPHVALIHVIAGAGQYGVAVQTPVLSCMGVKTSVVPSALWSMHANTPGVIEHRNDDLAPYVRHWIQCGLRFDGLVVGYLANREQSAQAMEVFDRLLNPDAIYLHDPRFAESGKLLATCDTSVVEYQKDISESSGVLLVNLSEACLLTRTQQPHGPCTRAQIATLVRRVLDLNAKGIVVLGIPIGDGQMANVCATARDDQLSMVSYRDLSDEFLGARDLFSATLMGRLIRGASLTQAMIFASGWTSYAIERTVSQGTGAQEGLTLELIMPLLATTGSGSPVDIEGERTVHFFRMDE